jgi:hypothetical protein
MRPRQQTARHPRPALINTSQRSEGAWESCLARNAACGRGRFLLNGVVAQRQGPRCQVALERGCNRRCGLPPRRRWRLSIAVTTGDVRDREITTLSMETEHPRRESADARIWMVSRRTAGVGGRHAPLRNAGTSGSDRG